MAKDEKSEGESSNAEDVDDPEEADIRDMQHKLVMLGLLSLLFQLTSQLPVFHEGCIASRSACFGV